MKKAILIMSISVIMLSFGFCFYNTSDNASANESIEITAKSAYVMDFDTKTVIFAKNENEKLPIASMVKIMTSLLTFEAIDSKKLSLNDEITISSESASMGGSQLFLSANSKHTVYNLLKSVVVASANDSSHALAERLGGSESGFVKMMNNRAKELKMENTIFANCTGLPALNQHSTAKDVSVMLSELLKHDKYFEFCKVWLEDYTHPDGRITTITNTNKLTRFYKGCDSGKTGFTNEAMFCLAASAKRGDMRIVSTIIGSPDSKTRFKEVSNMFNYAFGAYENKVLYNMNTEIANSVEVLKGKKSTIQIVPKKNITAFTKRGDNAEIEVKFELPTSVIAKISAGDVIGKAVVIKNGVVIDEIDLIANETIEKASFMDIIRRITDNW
ncbi:MAG: D-alanyl-D-alanine carboxypeptidase family protein [Clostridia bacterium]